MIPTDTAYVVKQYTNDVLVDEASLAKNYLLQNTTAQLTRASRTYVGKVSYNAGYFAMDYEYDISVSVYRSIEELGPTTYTPQNNSLTIAQFIVDAVNVLNLPIGYFNSIAGLIIGSASLVAGQIISWEKEKIPTLVCTSYSHHYYLYHYGTAPIYETGECIERTGTKYVVVNTNEQAEFAGDLYYEGLVVETKDLESADNIYHSLYTYTPYYIVGWT